MAGGDRIWISPFFLSPLTDFGYDIADYRAINPTFGGLAIYGKPLRKILNYEDRVQEYDKVREYRLQLVEEKIALTQEKILEQGRDDLHIIYELQRYVFIRECIAGRVFNRLSIKRPDLSIPGFNDIFARELGRCGLSLTISRLQD